MKKSILIAASVALLLTGCASEYNQVYKAATPTYKYEYAKQCFAQGKYSRAIPLLQEVVTMKKGSTEGEECLFIDDSRKNTDAAKALGFQVLTVATNEAWMPKLRQLLDL